MNVLNIIAAILESGQKTNSYKFALTLALSEAEQPNLSAEWLASRFLSYYWPLATSFRIRQSTDPLKEPVAFKWSAELHQSLGLEPGTPLAKAQQKHKDRFDDLIQRLTQAGGCLDEVIPRYHVLRREDLAHRVFSIVGRGIDITEAAWRELTQHRKVVRQLAIGGWVSFCEKISSSPRLYTKLSGDVPKRKSLGPYLSLLDQVHGGHCFYCGRAAPTEPHVDHFLPWSFVFEDKLWNLVISCGGAGGCNQMKSDRIPSPELTERLKERNRRMLRGEFGSELQSHRDFKEWKVWNLDQHIEQLSATALAEGFPTMRPAGC